MSRVVLVTGAARGIGLEFCRQLLAVGDTVVACPRAAGGADLDTLAGSHPDRLLLAPMDIGDGKSIRKAIESLTGRIDHIDVLFNNGAIYAKADGGLETLQAESLETSFRVNTIGPLRVVQACLPLLRAGNGKRLIQITSLMGSIGDNGSGGSYGYRMSKCALNMLSKNLAHELGHEGFISLAIHPGWVQTRMGGSGAPTELDLAVRQLLHTALETGPEENGWFLATDGRRLPH